MAKTRLNFEVEDTRQGFSVNKSNIHKEWRLSENTLNVSTGIFEGLSPRFGICSLGLLTEPTRSPSNDGLSTIASAEENAVTGTFQGVCRSYRVLNCLNILVSKIYNSPEKIESVCFLHGCLVNSYSRVNVTLPKSQDSFNIIPSHLSTLETINTSINTIVPSKSIFDYLTANATANARFGDLNNMNVDGNYKSFESAIFVNQKGSDYFTGYCIGQATSQGHANGIKFIIPYGMTKQISYGTESTKSRIITIYLNGDNIVNVGSYSTVRKYQQSTTPSGYFKQETTTGEQILKPPQITEIGSTAVNTVNYVVLKDEILAVDRDFSVVFCTGRLPTAFILRDYWKKQHRNPDGLGNTVIDSIFEPFSMTRKFIISNNFYTENGVQKSIDFLSWPNFNGTALPTTNTLNTYLGLADTGILRKNTTYELAFSWYFIDINNETNVSKPVLFRTGTDDNVSLIVFARQNAKNIFVTNELALKSQGFPFPLNSDNFDPQSITATETRHLNFLELRIYYRKQGEFEWKNAGYFHAGAIADPDVNQKMEICKGNTARSLGGQAGGFNDYSQLPEDSYFQVLKFQNRVFWLSAKQINYSRKDDLFSYPVNNSVTLENGNIVGAIVFTKTGEVLEESKLVIFGTETTYVSRFKGQEFAELYTVSLDGITSGQFPLDGSDFRIEYHSGYTAFSYRSAILAEGVLYWWGKQGVIKDDGLNAPERLSKQLYPLIDDLVHEDYLDRVHAQFWIETKEICWFFISKTETYKVNEQPTTMPIQKGLVLNVETGQFFFWEFKNYIEWNSKINVNSFSGKDLITGKRNICAVGAKENLLNNFLPSNEVYLFDARNCSAEYDKKDGIQIQEITYNSGADLYRLIPNRNINFSLQDFGGYIFNSKHFYKTQDFDCVFEVKNTPSSNYLEIKVPTGVTLPTGVIPKDKRFCVFLKNKHGIKVLIETTNYAPNWLKEFYHWQRLHMLFKTKLLKGQENDYFKFEFDFLENTKFNNIFPNLFKIEDNCKGNQQVLIDIKNDSKSLVQNNPWIISQALKTKISPETLWVAGFWCLTYLCYHVEDKSFDLKQWEGKSFIE